MLVSVEQQKAFFLKNDIEKRMAEHMFHKRYVDLCTSNASWGKRNAPPAFTWQ